MPFVPKGWYTTLCVRYLPKIILEDQDFQEVLFCRSITFPSFFLHSTFPSVLQGLASKTAHHQLCELRKALLEKS